MRIGLASYRCENKNITFNLGQIQRAMREAAGKADLICFGEAFLQGFDSLCWDYEIDRDVAVPVDSAPIEQLRYWTKQYHMTLLTGYIEKDQETIYSSCIVIQDGKVLHNYRRVSKGWKEYWKTDEHYQEGNSIQLFQLEGMKILPALCGDLWDDGWERFKTDHLVIWPVYVNYTQEEWESKEITEYAEQASKVARDVLMVNVIDHEPRSWGGAFHFHEGMVFDRLPFDQERTLIIDLPGD